MKVLVMLLISFLTTVIGDENIEDGQYKPDDSGQYVHDDSGRYIPDYSGLYHDDGTGRYNGDVRGLYSGVNPYNNGPFRGRHFSGNGNFLGAGSDYKREIIPPETTVPSTNQNTPQTNDIRQSIRAAPSYKSDDGRWKIIRQVGNVELDSYNWEYETENGITAAETGKVVNKGSKGETMQASGYFQYTGPDNVLYSISYTADENGFFPQGNHLPTSPPFPAAIAKSLKSQKASG